MQFVKIPFDFNSTIIINCTQYYLTTKDMGNKSMVQVDQDLATNRQKLASMLEKFYQEVLNKESEMVPLNHVFAKKIKLIVYVKEKSGKFFEELAKLTTSVVSSYAGNFDPGLFSDLTSFLAACFQSSSQGKLTEDRFYGVQKLKESVVRVDIFTVVQNVKTENAIKQAQKSLVGLYFVLSSVKIESLDENEIKLVDAMEPYEAPQIE